MLEDAVKRGFVVSVTNFVDEFLDPAKTPNPLSIPYLEEQYWVDVAEDVLKVFCPFDCCFGRS